MDRSFVRVNCSRVWSDDSTNVGQCCIRSLPCFERLARITFHSGCFKQLAAGALDVVSGSKSLHQRQNDIVDASLSSLPIVQHQATPFETDLLVEVPTSSVPPNHIEMYPGRSFAFDSIEQSMNQFQSPTLPLVLFKNVDMHVCRILLQLLRPCLQRATLGVVDCMLEAPRFFFLHL